MDRNISDYFPNVLKNVREFKALAESYQNEFEILWDNEQNILNNCFIDGMNEQSVSRMERQMGIVPKASQSLDERRFAVMLKNGQHPPYTMREVKNRLSELCDEGKYTIELNPDDYTLKVRIALDAQSKYDDVCEFLNYVVPANIIIDISIKYNKYSAFSTYTHQQLAQYTHTALREDEQFE